MTRTPLAARQNHISCHTRVLFGASACGLHLLAKLNHGLGLSAPAVESGFCAHLDYCTAIRLAGVWSPNCALCLYNPMTTHSRLTTHLCQSSMFRFYIRNSISGLHCSVVPSDSTIIPPFFRPCTSHSFVMMSSPSIHSNHPYILSGPFFLPYQAPLSGTNPDSHPPSVVCLFF
jgi:hypothetical protein